MFFISCTITSEEELASRLTASITSSQTAHPALNTSTLRLSAISLSLDVAKRRMHLGVYSKVKEQIKKFSKESHYELVSWHITIFGVEIQNWILSVSFMFILWIVCIVIMQSFEN